MTMPITGRGGVSSTSDPAVATRSTTHHTSHVCARRGACGGSLQPWGPMAESRGTPAARQQQPAPAGPLQHGPGCGCRTLYSHVRIATGAIFSTRVIRRLSAIQQSRGHRRSGGRGGPQSRNRTTSCSRDDHHAGAPARAEIQQCQPIPRGYITRLVPSFSPRRGGQNSGPIEAPKHGWVVDRQSLWFSGWPGWPSQ